ncbi:glycoprotein 3, partial [Escherichia coli]
AVVLNFERERLKGACDSTATAYRKAHHHLLSLYAEHELEHALNETCEALVRAMHLSILVQENPLANTTGHQGYIAPDKAVMQQVKSSLEQKIKQMQISLTGEPVLRLTGLSAATLPHMDYEVAGTPAQRKVWQDKIDQQGAELKARGLLS